MITLPYLLCSLLLNMRHAPAGTQLHVRLTTAVGSYSTLVGAPVSAVVIAPLIVQGETILPAGSTVSGRVKVVTRVGLGIRHETAGLDLEFSQITLPSGNRFPVAARVSEVDNARERVTRKGLIQGVRATGSPSYRVSGYIRAALQTQVESQLLYWALQALVLQVPEPEIYFPAGVELTLTLTDPVLFSASPGLAPPLAEDDRAELRRVIASLPNRTYTPGPSRPADLINVLLIGSRDQIVEAFHAAGWIQARSMTLSNRIQLIRATGDLKGYDSAPMFSLLLNEAEADMSWQKGLNDVSKRHHIRLWRQPGLWNGQELWIGAATRDIDFAYLRPGRSFSHRIEKDVDRERDKVAYDLAFTTCAVPLVWAERPDVPRNTRNATGDRMTTDTRLVAIAVTDCELPRLSTDTAGTAPVIARGDKLQRFVRRQILSARSDLLRDNIYWRGYEAVRWFADFVSLRGSSRKPAPQPE